VSGANPAVTRYAGLARSAGNRYKIDPAVLLADINQESGGHEATSATGARGLTQFEPATAAEYGVKFGTSPQDVESQINGQAKYLAALGGSKNIKAALEGYYTGQAGSSAGAGYASSVLAQVPNYKGLVGGAEIGSAGAAATPAAGGENSAQLADFQSLLSQLGSTKAAPQSYGAIAAPAAAADAGPTLGPVPAPIQQAASTSTSPSSLLSLVQKLGADATPETSSSTSASPRLPSGSGVAPNAKGGVGFTPAPGTNYSNGSEAQIASRANELAKALGIKVTGVSGYRSPQHSVAVGGFADDPHTKGEASDTPGIENVPEAVLNKYGLERPFSKIVNGKQTNPAEADHIQLLGSHKG
jgi:hypothetical protein